MVSLLDGSCTSYTAVIAAWNWKRKRSTILAAICRRRGALTRAGLGRGLSFSRSTLDFRQAGAGNAVRLWQNLDRFELAFPGSEIEPDAGFDPKLRTDIERQRHLHLFCYRCSHWLIVRVEHENCKTSCATTIADLLNVLPRPVNKTPRFEAAPSIENDKRNPSAFFNALLALRPA